MATTADSTQSVDLVHQFMDDVLIDREYGRIADLHEDFVQHDLVRAREVHGHDEFEAMRRKFDAGFSDLEITNILSFASDDGNYVCSVDRYRDTHDGEFMGVAPTDASVEIHGAIMARIEGGKIAEMWTLVDTLSLLQQIGAIPPSDELAA